MGMGQDDDLNLFVQWRHAPPQQWKYCPLCGVLLSDNSLDGKSRRYCAQCGFVYWERPLPAVAAVVYDEPNDAVLLVTRRYPPETGGYTFPGGGVEAGESLRSAAIREVHEETGLVVAMNALLGTWSTPNNETIITFYVSRPVSGTLKAGTDALSAAWFKRDQVPPLAFSVHQQVMRLFHHRIELERMGTR